MTLRRDVSASFQSRRDEPWEGLTGMGPTGQRIYSDFFSLVYQVIHGDSVAVLFTGVSPWVLRSGTQGSMW